MVMKFNPATGLIEDMPEDNPIFGGTAPSAAKPLSPELAALKPPPVNYPAPSAPTSAPASMADEPAIVPLDIGSTGPQEKITSTTSTGTSIKQTLPTAAEGALVQQRDAIDAKELDLQQRASEAGKAKAIEEEAAASERARLSQEKAEKTKEVVDQGEQRYTAALAERQAQYDALKGMKIQDYWESRGTGDRITAALGIALGSLGGGLTGQGGNAALEIINKAIDTDLERQKANISKQLSVVQAADKGIVDARERQEMLLNNVNVVKEAAYASIADKYAAMARKRGITDVDLQSDSNYQGLLRKQNDARLEWEKGLRKTVDSSTQKQVTKALEPGAAGKAEAVSEGQGKARGFASRMVGAVRNYDKAGGISPEGADKIRDHLTQSYIESKDATGLVKWVLRPGAKPLPSGLSEKDRLAWGAIEDFTRASLRKESGAVIGTDEFRADIDQIMPSKGDTPRIVEAKRRLMTQKLAATQQEIGRAKLNIPVERGSQGSGPPQTKVIGGKTYKKVDGGWAEAE